MKPEDMIYEGKAKRVFRVADNPDEVILEFKDVLTAFNAEKKGQFSGKGPLNLKITAYIFNYLGLREIPHHMVEVIDDRHMRAVKTEIIPLEVVVRNTLAGSTAKRLGFSEGMELKNPLVEFYLKSDDLGDPFVSDDQILAFEWVSGQDLKEIKTKALEVNSALKNLFSEIGIRLVDFKIEYGRARDGKILLSDEITPDSCRLWDAQTGEKLDKDRFRRDLGGVEEAYRNIWQRLQEREKSGKNRS
jgi:phosphoribosylaminoimidazole-succinocarboxamide synthase